MTRRISRLLAIGIAIAGLATVTNAQSPQKPDTKKAESPDGKWTLSAETPHGSMDFGLMLKVEGEKVSGTFATPQNGDIPIAGEYSNGSLTFQMTKAPEGYPALSFKARLKDDGTLAGTMSSDANDMVFVGKRAK